MARFADHSFSYADAAILKKIFACVRESAGAVASVVNSLEIVPIYFLMRRVIAAAVFITLIDFPTAGYFLSINVI
jgi:hypothetical protein